MAMLCEVNEEYGDAQKNTQLLKFIDMRQDYITNMKQYKVGHAITH